MGIKAVDLSHLKPDRRLAMGGPQRDMLRRRAAIEAEEHIEAGADALEQMALASGAILGEFAVAVRVSGARAVVELAG